MVRSAAGASDHCSGGSETIELRCVYMFPSKIRNRLSLKMCLFVYLRVI